MAAPIPSTEKGRRTRARIVQAAAELVAEKGALAMSLDDVEERANANRSQLYHYFENKADLVRTVVATTCDAVVGGQAQMLDGLDSWAGIEAWMDALVQLQVLRQARGGCPIGSLAGQLAEHDIVARAALAQGLDRWEQLLHDGLENLRTAGELRPQADSAELAKATLALVQGGLLLTQVHRDPQQLRAALDAALKLLRADAR